MKPIEPVDTKHIEFNKEFARAYDLLENGTGNLFITGKAGTGKSTLLQYFRDHTVKNVAVLAPTGVAAVNIKGQTIHSFFRFKPDITPEAVAAIKIRRTQKALYQKIEMVIIDEISMVRADLLDCVDMFLRMHGRKRMQPFGGVQMVFIGDLFQLSPVVTNNEEELFTKVYKSPYFFDSRIFQELNGAGDHPRRFGVVELRKIYRQKEEEFIKLLGTIRDRSATDDHLKMLNRRHKPDFIPDKDDFYIYLTTTNALADRINLGRLKALPEKPFVTEGTVTGKFESRNLPTHRQLQLNRGAQVMLLNNDPSGRWINGTIGKISEIFPEEKLIIVELSDGQTVDVTPFTWEMFRFFFNEDTQAVESESVGSFTQYPLRLAWAVTIHKSQGKTFGKVIVDIGYGAFAHGQTYVALSRCTSLDGLVLKKPILKNDILLDEEVVRFMDVQAPAEN